MAEAPGVTSVPPGAPAPLGRVPQPQTSVPWSPLPAPLEHFLQRHCFIPALTYDKIAPMWAGTALSMADKHVPGGVVGAAVGGFTVLAGLVAATAACLPPAWLTPLVVLFISAGWSVAGVGGLWALTTSALAARAARMMPYGTRCGSAVLRTPRGLWLAYAPLDARHVGVPFSQVGLPAEDLDAAVQSSSHLPSAKPGSTGWALHSDARGTVQVIEAAPGEDTGLAHDRRVVRVAGMDWLLFFSQQHNNQRS